MGVCGEFGGFWEGGVSWVVGFVVYNKVWVVGCGGVDLENGGCVFCGLLKEGGWVGWGWGIKKEPMLMDSCWHGWSDSNARHSVLETDALPTELHPCVVVTVQR